MARSPYWQGRAPRGLKPNVKWNALAESNRTGLPLSDVLGERERAKKPARKVRRRTAK